MTTTRAWRLRLFGSVAVAIGLLGSGCAAEPAGRSSGFDRGLGDEELDALLAEAAQELQDQAQDLPADEGEQGGTGGEAPGQDPGGSDGGQADGGAPNDDGGAADDGGGTWGDGGGTWGDGGGTWGDWSDGGGTWGDWSDGGGTWGDGGGDTWGDSGVWVEDDPEIGELLGPTPTQEGLVDGLMCVAAWAATEVPAAALKGAALQGLTGGTACVLVATPTVGAASLGTAEIPAVVVCYAGAATVGAVRSGVASLIGGIATCTAQQMIAAETQLIETIERKNARGVTVRVVSKTGAIAEVDAQTCSEMKNAEDQSLREKYAQCGVQCGVPQTCDDGTKSALQQKVDQWKAPGSNVSCSFPPGIPNNLAGACTDIVESWANALERADARYWVMKECFSDGGHQGPVGAGDYTHQAEWCSGLNSVTGCQEYFNKFDCSSVVQAVVNRSGLSGNLFDLTSNRITPKVQNLCDPMNKGECQLLPTQ